MEALTSPKSAPAKDAAGSDATALAPQQAAEIQTRSRVSRTRLAEGHAVLRPETTSAAELHPSIVTRRNALLKKRRRKRLLTAVALVLAVFPPMWAVYLIAWLFWRRKPRPTSMRRVKQGIKALEKNQTGVALKRLQEAHFQDPSNSDALYWLGLLLSRQGRQEEAVEALSLVAERVPGLPEVEAALVDAYIAQGQPEQAVFHAQRLLDTAPYATETLLKLADAFEAAGKPRMAIETLQRAPLHKPVLNDPLLQIHYRLGTLYEREGDAGRALHHFQRVYARDIAYGDVRARVQALEQAD